jgi:transketolase
VLAEPAGGARGDDLIATGSEVIALAAREAARSRGHRRARRLRALLELFAAQPRATATQVLGDRGARRVEAAVGFGWDALDRRRWGIFVGMAASAPRAPARGPLQAFRHHAEPWPAAVKKRLA